MKKLTRNKFDRKIAGICGGIGVYFGIDPTIIRIITLIIFVFTGFFPIFFLYILLIFIIPLEGDIL